jgi:hypothetical protein
LNVKLLRETAVVVRGTKYIRRETIEFLRESHRKTRSTLHFLRERAINKRTRTVKPTDCTQIVHRLYIEKG